MNLTRALAHLADVGVTVDVLQAGGVDPADPAQVRAEVETLLHSAVAENMITDMRGLAKLQMAFAALLTAEERAGNDVLAAVLRRNLAAAGVIVASPARV